MKINLSTEILSIMGRQILDSRGIPTVEVDVTLPNGVCGRASVPSGASTGSYEAFEKRDDCPTLYQGKSVLQAVKLINTEISSKLVGMDAMDQKKIDRVLCQLDGTQNKGRLGANAILSVSQAVCVAASNAYNMPLFRYIGGLGAVTMPTPLINILNGGVHADNELVIQEFMIVPYGADSFSTAVRMGAEIFYKLRENMRSLGYGANVGDEGGLAPRLGTSEEALDYILMAIESAGYTPGNDVALALDVAASEFYTVEGEAKKGYYLYGRDKDPLSVDDMVSVYMSLLKRYPIVSIEDAFHEDDWLGWRELTRKTHDQCQLVGDDLFVTNSGRITKGIQEESANAVLIKLNQVGTVTEAIETVIYAKSQKYATIVSHRSGETESSYIADFSVGTNSNQIKIGSMCRSDRLAKYNQLLRIEEYLGREAHFSGKSDFLFNK